MAALLILSHDERRNDGVVVASDELKTKLEIARRFTGKSTMDITKSIKLYIPEKHDVLVIEASDYNKACRIRVKKDIKSGE